MRVVLDSNVLISGIFWKGSPYNVLLRWLEGRFEILISYDIFMEYAKVLEKVNPGLSKEEIEKWLEIIFGNSVLIEPTKKFYLIKEDFADNKFVDAALNGGAEYIVSGDKHLRRLKNIEKIKILSPKQFLDMLRSK